MNIKITTAYFLILISIVSCTPNAVIEKKGTHHDTPLHSRALQPNNAKVDALPIVVPNNLLKSGGRITKQIVHLDLVAGSALWLPEKEEGPQVKVYAFSEKNQTPQIPGPLLRVKQGTRIKITIENRIKPGEFIGIPPSNRVYEGMETTTQNDLVIQGIKRAGDDISEVRVGYGKTQVLDFIATQPGKFIYWGSTSDQPIFSRTGIDAQLTGLIVVDPINESPNPEERLFLITMTDAFFDDVNLGPGEGIFELAINGLSWPHTERLHYPLNETQRWHWFNGSGFEHPMHLHGFHFRTLFRENGQHQLNPPNPDLG